MFTRQVSIAIFSKGGYALSQSQNDNHVTAHRQPCRPGNRPSAPQGNQCSISHFLASLGAQDDWYCSHIADQCCDQLTADITGYLLTSINWPYRGLRCRPIEVEYLFEVIRWQVNCFQMTAGSSLFFLIHMKYVVFYMYRRIKILISNWPRKLKFSQCLQGGKTCQLLLTFLTKGTRWSRSTSKFWLVKIWQVSSCGKFMQHASWNLFTLTAEADRVSTCDVFNCLFPLSVQNIRRLSKSEIRFGNGIVFVFHLAWCVRGLKNLKRFWPYLIVFNVSLMVSLSN